MLRCRRVANAFNVYQRASRLIAERGGGNSELTWPEVDTRVCLPTARPHGWMRMLPIRLPGPPPKVHLNGLVVVTPSRKAWIGPQSTLAWVEISTCLAIDVPSSRLSFSPSLLTVLATCAEYAHFHSFSNLLHVHTLVHPSINDASVTSYTAIYETGETTARSVITTTTMGL